MYFAGSSSLTLQITQGQSVFLLPSFWTSLKHLEKYLLSFPLYTGDRFVTVDSPYKHTVLQEYTPYKNTGARSRPILYGK
jgi:hypothetical protein